MGVQQTPYLENDSLGISMESGVVVCMECLQGMGNRMPIQEANVKQRQWPKIGCFRMNRAWKPAMVGSETMPAAISVGIISSSGNEPFSQTGCPFVSGLNGNSCSLAPGSWPLNCWLRHSLSQLHLFSETQPQGPNRRSHQEAWPLPLSLERGSSWCTLRQIAGDQLALPYHLLPSSSL